MSWPGPITSEKAKINSSQNDTIIFFKDHYRARCCIGSSTQLSTQFTIHQDALPLNNTSNQLPLPLTHVKSNQSDINITNEQQILVAELTVNQSQSLDWYAYRLGRITSSTIHGVMHTKKDKPVVSIINNICQPKSFSTAATQWGKDYEFYGVQTIQAIYGHQHNNFTTIKCGLIISVKHPFIVVSPDALASCDCHGKAVVEVKCPYAHQGKSIEEYQIDRKHKYYSQVQLQMYVLNVPICYFVVWTPSAILIQNIPAKIYSRKK